MAAWKASPPIGLNLQIIGDGPERRNLEQMASGLRSVRFLGRRPNAEISHRLVRSRAAVVPSIWYEGQPMSVLEAFAAGTPVLGSNIGGVGETLASLDDRWRCSPGDIEDWTRGIHGLASDRYVDEAGLTARAAYEAQHTPNIALRRLEGVYANVSKEHNERTRSMD
jgi:glycosyltransferase involved in cell wall biosynthesis